MRNSRFPLPHLALRMVTLGILSVFVAELALPAVLATHGAEARTASPRVEGHGPQHGSSEHHHPGCPWRGKGPCPHQASGPARGPAISACADAPAATADGAASLLLAVGPVLDSSFRPMETRRSVIVHRDGRSTGQPSPEPPPPRPSGTL